MHIAPRLPIKMEGNLVRIRTVKPTALNAMNVMAGLFGSFTMANDARISLFPMTSPIPSTLSSRRSAAKITRNPCSTSRE